MGVNYATLIYNPAFAMFARPVTFNPLVSQPGVAAYAARGIYHSDLQVLALLDGSTYTDQQTSIDVLDSEFPIKPQQGDQFTIDADSSSSVGSAGGMPALGTFEVTAVWNNGGGETSLTLRKWVTPAP